MAKKKKTEKPAPINDIMKQIDSVGEAMGLSPSNLLTGGYLQGSIPTGSWVLDLITGGGWARNRWSTITGWEGAGKSTLLYEAGASAQRLGIPVIVFDHEGAFDAAYCRQVGFDIDDKQTRIFQPDTGEFTFRFINRLCKVMEDAPVGQLLPQCFIMIDSLASMVPEAQMDADEDNALSLQARMFSIYIRLVKSQLSRKGLTILATNQMREKPMVMYGSPEYEPGGNAIKFYPDLKLRIRRKSVGKQEIVGAKMGAWLEDGWPTMKSNLTTLKNKGFPPFQEGELFLHMGRGVAPVRDRLAFLTYTGMLLKNFNVTQDKSVKGTDSFNIPGWALDGTIVRGDAKRLEACHDSALDGFIEEALKSSKAFEMFRSMRGMLGALPAVDEIEGEELPAEAQFVQQPDGSVVDTVTGEVVVTEQEPEVDEDPEHLATQGSQEPLEKAEQVAEEVITNGDSGIVVTD
jgi:protein RecA